MLTLIPAAKNSLRNKQLPTAVQSITVVGSGRQEAGRHAGRHAGGRGEVERSGRSCVYKPDRWSGAPTRTIKQKTTGCFLAEPGIAPYSAIARLSGGGGANKGRRID